MKFSFTVASAPHPWRLAILALGLLCPVALMAKNPPIIVQSPPLQASSATLERLEKLGAFRSGPILFQVGCKAVQGRIVKVFIERSSRYSFLDREGVDWVAKHWSFGLPATGTYHIPLVVGARKTGPGAGKPLPLVAQPGHLVPKLSKATWDALLQSRTGAAFTARLIVKVEVRDGAVLSARPIRSTGVAMADSAVIDWTKNRWRFQQTAQGRGIFEFHINVDPSPKRRGIVVTGK